MTRNLAVIALIALGCACTPMHNVKPLPDFVNKALQPGDKVVVTTTAGETIEMTVREVSKEAITGEKVRVAIADIVTLMKVSWNRPASPCGGEKPLGCSVPLLVSLSSDVHRHYGDHFYDACAQHDYCYRHGFRTYGLGRDTCDEEFLRDMRNLCPAESATTFGKFMDILNILDTDADSRRSCLSAAEEFHVVVQTFGESRFQISGSTFCAYNGPP